MIQNFNQFKSEKEIHNFLLNLINKLKEAGFKYPDSLDDKQWDYLVKNNIVSQQMSNDFGEAIKQTRTATDNYKSVAKYLYMYKSKQSIRTSQDITQKEINFMNKQFDSPLFSLISLNKEIDILPNIRVNRILIGDSRIFNQGFIKLSVKFTFYINNKMIPKAFPVVIHCNPEQGETVEESYKYLIKEIKYTLNASQYKGSQPSRQYLNQNDLDQFIADKLLNALINSNVFAKISKIE